MVELIKIVYFGDSITAGQHIDPALRWTSLVNHRLEECHRNDTVVVYAVNRGVSGDTTRMALERYPADVQAMLPDILTIQFGMNDCNCWLTDRGMPRVSLMAFKANVMEMIARARAFGVRHIIIANSHITLRTKFMLNNHSYESANAEYSQALEDIAHTTGCRLCDIRRVFCNYHTDKLEALLLPYPDQLHLSPAGHRVYADTIWEPIQQACQDILQERKNDYEKQD